MMSLHSSSFMRISNVSRVMPALFTNTPGASEFATDLGDELVDGRSVRDVQDPARASDARLGQRRRDAFCAFARRRGSDDDGPVTAQRRGNGLADPPRRPGYQGHLTFEIHELASFRCDFRARLTGEPGWLPR